MGRKKIDFFEVTVRDILVYQFRYLTQQAAAAWGLNDSKSAEAPQAVAVSESNRMHQLHASTARVKGILWLQFAITFIAACTGHTRAQGIFYRNRPHSTGCERASHR
jgi:hypothetical protein